jgi:hypothetical protein
VYHFSTLSESLAVSPEETPLDIAGLKLRTLHSLPKVSTLSDEQLVELNEKLTTFETAINYMQEEHPEYVETWNKLKEDIITEQNKRLQVATAEIQEVEVFTLDSIGKKLINMERRIEQIYKDVCDEREDLLKQINSAVRNVVRDELKIFMTTYRAEDEDEDEDEDDEEDAKVKKKKDDEEDANAKEDDESNAKANKE